VASTYPPRKSFSFSNGWQKNKNLKDKALADAAKKQDWDPSIQAMAALSGCGQTNGRKTSSGRRTWATRFLAQQSDVMGRGTTNGAKKAKDAGNLKSSEQQKVETQVVESKQVIVIQQASPEVVYVPSYNPTVVYGAPAYSVSTHRLFRHPGYYAAGMAISFGIGVAMGAALGRRMGLPQAGWGGNNNVTVNRKQHLRKQLQSAETCRIGRPAAATTGSTIRNTRGRCSLFKQGDRQQVWWHNSRRFDVQSAGKCPSEPGAKRGSKMEVLREGANRQGVSDRSAGGRDALESRWRNWQREFESWWRPETESATAAFPVGAVSRGSSALGGGSGAYSGKQRTEQRFHAARPSMGRFPAEAVGAAEGGGRRR